MVPYLVCFILSCVFARFDEYFKKNHHKILAFFSAFLAIGIPCVLAGARDIGIGTDTSGYAEPLFNAINTRHYSIVELLNSSYAKDIETVVLFLYYGVSLFSDNIFWVFFFTEFICLVPVYVTIGNSKISSDLKWLSLFAYYCLFYCYTLNLMRQMMAVAVVFSGFNFLRQGKTKRYIILVLFSMLIHKTAIIGIVIWPLYSTCVMKRISLSSLFSVKDNSNLIKLNRWLYRNRFFLLLIYIIMSLVVLFSSTKLIKIISVVKKSYAYQFEHINSSFNLSFAPLVLMIMYIFPCILWYKILVNKNSEYRFFFFMSFISIILWQLQGVSSEMYRVVLYIWFYIIVAIPYFVQAFHDKFTKLTISVYYTFLLFFNWYYYFVIWCSGEVIPYHSKLLGI